jgi:hypothetical protein
MNNPHDDDLDTRVEMIRRKPHWERTDYDRDDIDSWHMIEGLSVAADEYHALKKLEASLLSIVSEINKTVTF